MHDNKNNSGFGEWEKGTDDSLSSLLVLGTFYKLEGSLTDLKMMLERELVKETADREVGSLDDVARLFRNKIIDR